MTNAGRPALHAQLLPRAAVLGADYRGGRDGSKASLREAYNVIPNFTNAVIDYNTFTAYMPRREAQRKPNPRYRRAGIVTAIS
jgi:hypothetical protein